MSIGIGLGAIPDLAAAHLIVRALRHIEFALVNQARAISSSVSRLR